MKMGNGLPISYPLWQRFSHFPFWGLPLPVVRYGLEPCSADWPHGQARRRELAVLQVPPAAKGVRLPGAGPSAWVWAEPFSIHLVGSCYRRG